ncbi:uncharacterized protein LOC116433821 [Nomia melanderi]|uniref:uncharacterized protein LOC116433821 n=1 Tax=Nomia melanderi TaxID=2448451 RepID=UPI0013045800|nr:uncharacterized protein LOC116433821 [Nomia melanderi]XP_031848203.1 uncharacterized protein LOC116433821 [Nomia melanderi]XP_031848205.1 uncharacterized protein LOC116433821 [Nomia melanderi]XP_031848206.1 uncharacterized protein LOC116433821 [Nomia melanderi]
MTKDMLSPNRKKKQLLKKSKTDINDTLNDDLSNNVQTSQEAYLNTDHIRIKNERTPTKTENDNINLQINNCNVRKRRNVSESSNNNDELTNNTRSCLISIRKIEDLCKTPIKNNELNESMDATNIKKEIFSPVRCSPRNVKITPNRKKKRYYEEDKFSKRKRRKINDTTEYDQLSDSVKTELYDNNVHDMEHIEMLHDLDSVMDFEDTKIPDFLCSTTNDVKDEQSIEIFKDPQVDPLFIDVNDIHDSTIENGNEEQEKENAEPRFYLRKRVKTVEQKKLNNKKFCDTPIGIKAALGKLYIKSDTEDEEISESTQQELYNLKVQIMHDVPLQHQIERSAGSKSLTKAEKSLFLKYASLRKGCYLPQEDETIINNWKKFCEVHNWNSKIVKPFICIRNGNRYCIRSSEERQKFVQFLANGLPCRSLYSVLQRFKNLFGKYKKSCTRYSLVEDEIILSYMKKNWRRKKHNNYAKLAKMLNRKRHSVWLRYYTLKNMQDKETKKSLEVQWTLELIGKFIQNLMNIMLCENIKELKDAIIPKPVWVKLEEKLNINHETLRKFWLHQLHMQLYCPESIYLNDIKIKLIEYMYGKGISNAREIIWRSVAKYFEGVTTMFLSKVFIYLVQEVNKKLNTTYFPDIIEYLYNRKIPAIQNSLVDKFLPRLFYDNGNVKIIDEDIKTENI